MTGETSDINGVRSVSDAPPYYALAERAVDVCRDRGLTLVTAESCTGGLLAGAITAVPGSSRVFDRGFVTYSNQAKVDQLDVDPDTICAFGAVSYQVALEMAHGAQYASGADVAVAVTGIAGPGGSDGKPEGLVYITCLSDYRMKTLENHFGAPGREIVRRKSVECALDLIVYRLLGTTENLW